MTLCSETANRGDRALPDGGGDRIRRAMTETTPATGWLRSTIGIVLIFGVLLALVAWAALGFPTSRDYVPFGGDSVHSLGGRKQLEPCPARAPIPLPELSNMGRPKCDLGAAKIEVAPGVLIDVPDESNSVVETEAGRFGIVNLKGDLGVVVYNDDEQWGVPKAAKLVREAGWEVS